MNNIIRISSRDYAIARDLIVNQNKKIGAIKHIRSTGVLYEDGVQKERVGLKEAKEACEYEFNVPSNWGSNRSRGPVAMLAPTPRIKRVVIDTGGPDGGELELDLDGLQLRLLDGLAELPIRVIGPAMELMSMLRDFDEGKSIQRGDESEQRNED